MKKNNLKVTVHAAVECEKEIKRFFHKILEDYCLRFGVTVLEGRHHVQVSLIECDTDAFHGTTIRVDDEERILVQVRDPFLNDWEPNIFTLQYFVSIIAHEFVHVCQYLTGREGFAIPGATYKMEDYAESYFFDPYEVEARVLQDVYMSMYGQELLL